MSEAGRRCSTSAEGSGPRHENAVLSEGRVTSSFTRGGWTLRLRADRRTDWRIPHGTMYHDDTTTDRVKPAPTVTAASSTVAETVAAQPEHVVTAITSRALP